MAVVRYDNYVDIVYQRQHKWCIKWCNISIQQLQMNIASISLIDWISDTLSQGDTNFQIASMFLSMLPKAASQTFTSEQAS